jgi:hypothetical protein
MGRQATAALSRWCVLRYFSSRRVAVKTESHFVGTHFGAML